MSISSTTVNGVARIEIARPEKKNAITAAMYQSMAESLSAAHDDPAARSILICGHKDIFTAGNDLEDFMKNPPADMNAPVFQFMQTLGYAEKPVIAAVNGAAVGIGTTMLMHCDLVYCADNSVFSMPFVSLGLCPEFASSFLVPLNAGYHKAVEKLLLGDPISADEAVEMKIVNQVLPRDDVLDYAVKQAERFNQLPPASVRATKRLLRSGWKTVTEKVIVDEANSFGKMLRSAEAKEAFTAFFERRKPDFSEFT
ncbi:MAG TPA: enoyl-CoA hydratase [Burkholderiaceae bacterium]|nr:enoyl-CoA hydratase [Burkholderiaceae bacterium]